MPYSNEIIRLIHQHGSVRNYRDETLPEELIRTIIHAGQRASTSSNLQMVSAIVVQNKDTLNQLSILCGNQSFIAQAPVFIAWCADLSRLGRISERLGYIQEAGYMENLLLTTVDVSLMMQNAALAAESLGLGICYIGGIRNNPAELIQMFNLPPLVFPMVGMTLGWPEAAPRIRPRLALDAILHWEAYNTSAEESHIAAYDQAMIATGIYQGRQVKGGHETAFEEKAYGWAEHSARRVSKVQRAHLRDILKAQGFEMK